ncbi:acyl-coenzyme A thioesterase PaaI-like protein [Vogesella perlucida]|nr:acyl-coenzyme A thioesterase PaaI-like protein [Vogesella perlucida]
MTTPKNSMCRMVDKTVSLPTGLRSWVITRMFGKFVPFLGTAGLVFEEVSRERMVVSVKNRKKVQNHIKGLHAAAMALLAETATGFVVGMNVPDDKLMLLKSMKVSYYKRAQGNMRAVATLPAAQVQRMFTEDKGDVLVDVVVTDESGESPIVCEMVWAWVPKKR